MPCFPRPNDNLKRIAQKIMGKPGAQISKKTPKQQKLDQELGRQEIRYVRD